MNIWEFRKLWFNLFNNNVMNRFAANLKVEYEDNGGVGGEQIAVYDKNTRVAYMEFDVSPENKVIWVELVFVAEKYSSHNLALKMFKEFYKNYKSKWWGYAIYAEFANAELSKFFSDAVKKGWFPEEANQTEDMNLTDEEFKNFKQQMNDDTNERINLIGDIPEPILKDTEHSKKDMLVGYDTVYKNLTVQQVKNLNDYYANHGPSVIMFDGSNDSYFGFFTDYSANTEILSQLSIKCAFYIHNKEIVTTDMNLVTQYINVMQQYSSKIVNGGTIILYPNGLYNGDKQEFEFNSIDQINEIIQNNKNASKSRLRKIKGGK